MVEQIGHHRKQHPVALLEQFICNRTCKMRFAGAIIPKKDHPPLWFFGKLKSTNIGTLDATHIVVKGGKRLVMEGAQITHLE